MNHLSKGQARAAVILIGIVLFVLLVLLALIDISIFFVALILLVAAICFLKIKKPEFFAIFQKNKADAEQKPTGIPKKPDEFAAHIILLYQNGVNMQQVTVNKPEFSVGRGPKCSFVLYGNTNISHEHAILCYNAQEKNTSIIDKSKNGTKLNGEFLPPNTPRILHNGDIIQIEDRVLTVQNKNY